MLATMIVVQGDPEEIHRTWRERLLPAAGPRAEELGWIRSLVAQGDGELVILNLWRDEAGLERAMTDPEINRIQDAELKPLATGEPEIRRLEVVDDLTF